LLKKNLKMRRLSKFFASILLLIFPATAHSTGGYVPPCYEQRTAMEDSLRTFHECLTQNSKPPFDEKEPLDNHPICQKQMNDFQALRTTYRGCLMGITAPPNSRD
jgi:hypothetical protein